MKCDACAQPARFLDANLECPECAKGSPQERAAIALHTAWEERAEPATPTAWEDLYDDIRDSYRREADLALTAAINVGELAEHIGWHHATIVRDHYLGSDGAK